MDIILYNFLAGNPPEFEDDVPAISPKKRPNRSAKQICKDGAMVYSFADAAEKHRKGKWRPFKKVWGIPIFMYTINIRQLRSSQITVFASLQDKMNRLAVLSFRCTYHNNLIHYHYYRHLYTSSMAKTEEQNVADQRSLRLMPSYNCPICPILFLFCLWNCSCLIALSRGGQVLFIASGT